MDMHKKHKKIEEKYRAKLLSKATTDDFAEAYDEIHTFFKQERYENIYRDSFSLPASIITVKYPPGVEILEIETGNGFTAIKLAKRGYHVTTIDISKVALDVARQRMRSLALPLKIEYCDARSLNFRENTFDAVISSSLVEHLNEEDVEIHLKEVQRVLRPSGCYYFWLIVN